MRKKRKGIRKKTKNDIKELNKQQKWRLTYDKPRREDEPNGQWIDIQQITNRLVKVHLEDGDMRQQVLHVIQGRVEHSHGRHGRSLKSEDSQQLMIICEVWR